MCVLDQCSDHEFSDLQFGFTDGRGTSMAVSLAEDVTTYCVDRGSPVFTCSLDAESAFDGLPHPMLFNKITNIVPDSPWRLLYFWYLNQDVIVKWNNSKSEPIPIQIGTRQGGLSSPYLFNVFYQDLIEELDKTPGGLKVNNRSFCVFCYADDVLLASTTATGLQNLIDAAVRYVQTNGLRFNPTKTKCFIKGSCPFDKLPTWTIENVTLDIVEEINYLGVKLSNKSGKNHVSDRIRSCQRAFFSLQNCGMCKNGLDPETVSELCSKCINPVLTYGCETVSTSQTYKKSLIKIQCKLLKAALGLKQCSRNSLLLDSLKIASVTDTIDNNAIGLFNNILCRSKGSRAKHFYVNVISNMVHNCMYKHINLGSRVQNICEKRGISRIKCIFDHKYVKQNQLCNDFTPEGQNGLIDSVRALFSNYNKTNCDIACHLLKAF